MRKPAAMLAAGSAGFLGTIGVAAGGILGQPALAIAASVIQGLAMGAFSLVIIIAGCRAKNAFKMGLLISSSVTLGMFVDTLLLALQEVYLIAMIALLPVLCALVSRFALNGLPENCEGEGEGRVGLKHRASYRGLFAFIGAFSLMLGFLQYFSTFSATWMHPNATPLLVARFAAMVAILVLLCTRRVRVDIVLRAGIIVSLVGFSFISNSFFLPEIREAGVFAASAGYACFDVIAWSILSEIALYAPAKGSRIAASGVFVWQLGMAAGAGAGLAFDTMGLPDAFMGMAASIVALCVVGVGVHFMGSELWIAVRYGDPRPAESNEEPSMDAVAARYLLTKREVEMLSYFVKGRTIPYIAESECISENTVRNHTKSIYAKLGVHTRQELLDIVEMETSPTRIM